MCNIWHSVQRNATQNWELSVNHLHFLFSNVISSMKAVSFATKVLNIALQNVFSVDLSISFQMVEYSAY